MSERGGQSIGVFDSGIGGLSILKALRAELPHENFIYIADSRHAPYGERGDAFVIARSRAIVRHLRERHRIKALVIACNTATAAAGHLVRAEHPDLPLVGVEPALKPAVALSRTGRIGVIGTRGTVTSAKFQALLATLQGQAGFVVQPCDGLAQAIEQGVDPSEDQVATKIGALCTQYTRAMGRFGTEPGDIDTLVLGCTHYLFAAPQLRDLLGEEVRLIETGEPVARQTRRLLAAANQLSVAGPGVTQLLTTGQLKALQTAARHWLQLVADPELLHF
ncbi:MAG: glutamate racemase [Polaromonas sp.]